VGILACGLGEYWGGIGGGACEILRKWKVGGCWGCHTWFDRVYFCGVGQGYLLDGFLLSVVLLWN